MVYIYIYVISNCYNIKYLSKQIIFPLFFLLKEKLNKKDYAIPTLHEYEKKLKKIILVLNDNLFK